MPLTDTFFAFPIDHEFLPVFAGKKPKHWRDAAKDKGFDLIGRTLDRYHVVLECNQCGNATRKRISVVLGHNPECGHCIEQRRKAAAESVGAVLLGPDPDGDRHYGEYQFDCGHVDRRQHMRVEAAAAGGFKLSCQDCTYARHVAEAEFAGWQLVGPAVRNNQNYRHYRHDCGHHQDVSVANMRNLDVNCSGCEESWASKPSAIYLLTFMLPNVPVIKLGFSNNPTYRVKQVQFDPAETRGTLDREIEMKTGHAAICLEKALHHHIKSERPDLIVSRDHFSDHLRTTSEIYHERGRSYISSLLDAVEAGWDPNRCNDWKSFTAPRDKAA